MVVLDTTALSLLFVEGAAVRGVDGAPVKYARERIAALIERLAKDGEKVVIPTPALSEFLVRAGDRIDEFLKLLRTSPWFRIEPFDSAAAVALAKRTAKAIAEGDKREGLQADWTKVKFDRQIVTIAIVCGATTILSDDADVRAIGERWGLKVVGIEDLPVPAECIPPPLLENAFPEEGDAQPDVASGPTT